MSTLREDAKYIYTRAIEVVLPDEAVRRALELSGTRDPRCRRKGGVAHGVGGKGGARR